jgi:adenosylcobinamide kinase / adenosylcobinamide-phosphate guanylyltransferase
MWLITGGAFQGKLAYACKIFNIEEEKIIDGASCQWEEMLKASLVNHFHLWIRRMLQEEQNVYKLLEEIIRKNSDIIIIVDELGCGIVPIKAFDRNYRETCGRVCCQIAKNSKEVHRVISGIGMVIKHA